MKFEELSKEHQEFLRYCLSDYIRKGTIDGIIFPSYEEYKAFFDEFDKEYEIVDGLPESKQAQSQAPLLGEQAQSQASSLGYLVKSSVASSFARVPGTFAD